MSSHPTSIDRSVSARIPTAHGEFRLDYFTNTKDDKEHLALVIGDISGCEDVLTRVHSECFTGEVLGSQRCDCAAQLDAAIEAVAREGAGVIIYLRQEGRGIGLLDKLRAYNLQDQGLDTVDANLLLGHQADEREYGMAALILEDLGVKSIRLMTNNPTKVEKIRELGVNVASRVPVPGPVTTQNLDYLTAKVERMGHMLEIEAPDEEAISSPFVPAAEKRAIAEANQRPFVTLTYAQSLDGSIARADSMPLSLSGSKAAEMTHLLRSSNDAILVGIGTVIADDPRLTVRLADGKDPQPIVLDSRLRCPLNATLLKSYRTMPWFATRYDAPADRQVELEAAGARVLRLPAREKDGLVDLNALMATLFEDGVRSLMVEGGARVITELLAARFVDHVVITIAPMLVGGLHAVAGANGVRGASFPRLQGLGYKRAGDDLIVWGRPDWSPD